MKFDVLPIINECPVNIAPFKEQYKDSMTAKLAFQRSKWVFTRTRLAEAQNWKCCFCGCKMIETHGKRNSVTVEHVVPKSKGGSNGVDNLAASCHACNNNRGTQDVEQFMLNRSVSVKNREQCRLEARVRKYLAKAKKLADMDFKVNETIQSFEQWFATLRLNKQGRDMFFAEYTC